MYLRQLDVHGLRNLQSVKLSPGPRINTICGPNGSGKTSLLEAIYLLGRGRSFRSRSLKSIINTQTDSCTVFGLVCREDGSAAGDSILQRDIPIGVSRTRSGGFHFKLDGERVYASSVLAQALPLLLLNNDSFQLLEGGPQGRRQFLDWGVFHVEQDFKELWRRLARCLQHRNSLLRHDRIDPSELALWDAQFVALAERVTVQRKRYLDGLAPQINQVLQRLSPIKDLQFRFHCGWDERLPLADVLVKDRRRDQQARVTHHGPHRADLKIVCGDHAAAEVLSRGQSKALVTAMLLAQGLFYFRATGRTCVYLVDDLPAELDKAHRQAVARFLGEMQAQAFITGADEAELLALWPDRSGGGIGHTVFHVEQGVVRNG